MINLALRFFYILYQFIEYYNYLIKLNNHLRRSTLGPLGVVLTLFSIVGKLATLPAVSCASRRSLLNVIRQRNETHRPLSGAWNHTDADHIATTGFSTAFNIHITTLNL